MNLGQQILFFFSALGVFNGFIISLYLLFFKKSKSPTYHFLGLMLLGLCLKIGKSFIYYFYPDLPGIYIQIGLWGSTLIGPSIFYFIKSTFEQDIKVTTIQKANYLFCLLAIVTTSIIAPFDINPNLWTNYIWLIIALQFTFYMLLTGWLLRSILPKLFIAKEKISQTERLVLYLFMGNVVIPASFKLSIFDFFNGPCISGALFFSLILYLNLFLFISKRKTIDLFSNSADSVRYANKKIANEQARTLTEKLDKIVLEQKLYKNPDLKLNDLAKKINVSGHQLSQLLNDNLNKSFAVYINEYRINEACELIVSNKTIKLEAIGYEVGFNSKSTFYTAFKKHKHTTPTLYKEGLSIVPSI